MNIYSLTLLEIRSPKMKVLARLHSSRYFRGESLSFVFPSLLMIPAYLDSWPQPLIFQTSSLSLSPFPWSHHLLCLSSQYSCNYTGPTQRAQDNVSVWRSLSYSHLQLLGSIFKVPGIRMWTSLGKLFFNLPDTSSSFYWILFFLALYFSITCCSCFFLSQYTF